MEFQSKKTLNPMKLLSQATRLGRWLGSTSQPGADFSRESSLSKSGPRQSKALLKQQHALATDSPANGDAARASHGCTASPMLYKGKSSKRETDRTPSPKSSTTDDKTLEDRRLRRVFVDGINADISEADLRDAFSHHGEIEEVARKAHRNSSRRYYAFVVYKTSEGCCKATANPNPMVKGRQLRCWLAAIGEKRSGYAFFHDKGIIESGSGKAKSKAKKPRRTRHKQRRMTPSVAMSCGSKSEHTDRRRGLSHGPSHKVPHELRAEYFDRMPKSVEYTGYAARPRKSPCMAAYGRTDERAFRHEKLEGGCAPVTCSSRPVASSRHSEGSVCSRGEYPMRSFLHSRSQTAPEAQRVTTTTVTGVPTLVRVDHLLSAAQRDRSACVLYYHTHSHSYSHSVVPVAAATAVPTLAPQYFLRGAVPARAPMLPMHAGGHRASPPASMCMSDAAMVSYLATGPPTAGIDCAAPSVSMAYLDTENDRKVYSVDEILADPFGDVSKS